MVTVAFEQASVAVASIGLGMFDEQETVMFSNV
jgi:hypothetical protein